MIQGCALWVSGWIGPRVSVIGFSGSIEMSRWWVGELLNPLTHNHGPMCRVNAKSASKHTHNIPSQFRLNLGKSFRAKIVWHLFMTLNSKISTSMGAINYGWDIGICNIQSSLMQVSFHKCENTLSKKNRLPAKDPWDKVSLYCLDRVCRNWTNDLSCVEQMCWPLPWTNQ